MNANPGDIAFVDGILHQFVRRSWKSHDRLTVYGWERVPEIGSWSIHEELSVWSPGFFPGCEPEAPQEQPG